MQCSDIFQKPILFWDYKLQNYCSLWLNHNWKHSKLWQDMILWSLLTPHNCYVLVVHMVDPWCIWQRHKWVIILEILKMCFDPFVWSLLIIVVDYWKFVKSLWFLANVKYLIEKLLCVSASLFIIECCMTFCCCDYL